MSLKEADKLTPQIHLSSIINSLAPLDVKTDRLIVMSPSYMKNLSSILSSSSKEVLQTYFIWKVVQAYSSVIEANELKPYSRFSNELQGKVKILCPWTASILMTSRTQIRLQNGGEHAYVTWTMDLAGSLVDFS
jgi:predicted metalloendopeptidase